MHTGRSVATLGVTIVLAASALGCRRESPPPVAETQTQTPVQTAAAPTTVGGCLRAGEAGDTFVLTTTGQQATTYHLTAGPGIALEPHVGREVQLEGIVSDRQQTTARAAGSAGQETAGTSGRPTVETRTEIEAASFDVRSVRSVGGECR